MRIERGKSDLKLSHPLQWQSLTDFEMVLEDMSWHLRYYEYSYMYYIVGSAALCLAYAVIYCVKMPVNKIKNLKDVIDFDPQINEGLYEIIRAGEQG